MHKNQADQKASTQDNNLEFKINNRTHVDEKAQGVSGGFLSSH